MPEDEDEMDPREPAAGSAFERTFLGLLSDCRAFALSLARNPHDADDLVQETFLRAQRAFHTFTPGTNAKAWLFTILKRLDVDRHRRARLRPAPLPDEDLEERARAEEEGTAGTEFERFPPRAVLEALEEVPEPFRLPVRLRDLDGFSYREIAEILDVPAGTVMSRLFRGREYVRRALVSRMGEAARTRNRP
jgi:RNA polymerase sigma-70 factor (ECF subfamily)